jgi:hypothetical protein
MSTHIRIVRKLGAPVQLSESVAVASAGPADVVSTFPNATVVADMVQTKAARA